MILYVVGEVSGADVKIGITTGPVGKRLTAIDRDQMNGNRYALLAALHGDGTAETSVHKFFDEYRADKGSRTEYFRPGQPLIEWILWLRQQWYVATTEDEVDDALYAEHPSSWLPHDPSRRVPPPPIDPGVWLQPTTQVGNSPLANTWWAFMPDPLPSFQDYFTPPDIVRRASLAMGGVDLDAASHFLAHKRFWKAGVEIGDYFHIGRSAFDHDWCGNVWLNPPYGDNAPWFARAADMLDRGPMRQLCFLSPVWAFTTQVARPFIRTAQASVILTPTPAFENPSDPKKAGSNHPHAIFYWGNRADAFLDAYEDVGIPFMLIDRRKDTK